MRLTVALLPAIMLGCATCALGQKAGGREPGMPGPRDLEPVQAVAPDQPQEAAAAPFTAPPAIAVAGGFVFVIYQGVLYQFSVDGLKPVATARLRPVAPGKAREGRARAGAKAGKPDKVAPAVGGQ